jgi:serine/threonine-protein kinase haspin
LETRSWHHVLPSRGFQLDKIAEASYAEVYRVTSWKTRKESERTSILKIMRLISPHDPSSYECETAMEVGNVVSEFRIMNALTELPGFVTFKGAFLIQGQPGKHYFKAWDKFHHESKEGSYFTDPRFYDENTTFLVIELGDAGTVLEDYQIESIDELWDIYLGTVIALAKGEMACEFEVSPSVLVTKLN